MRFGRRSARSALKWLIMCTWHQYKTTAIHIRFSANIPFLPFLWEHCLPTSGTRSACFAPMSLIPFFGDALRNLEQATLADKGSWWPQSCHLVCDRILRFVHSACIQKNPVNKQELGQIHLWSAAWTAVDQSLFSPYGSMQHWLTQYISVRVTFTFTAVGLLLERNRDQK